LAAVWLVAVVCQVFAQTVPVAQAFADAPPDEAELVKAEALATEAKVFFKAKLYGKAAGRFMEAYAISRRPSLMYNAARAYEEGRNLREAHALFQEYRKLPDIGEDGRKDADARIARLEADMRTADAEARARAEKKVEPHVEPKVEPRVEPKVEPRVEPKVQPRVEPKVELKPLIHKEDPAPTFPVVKASVAGGALALSLTAWLVARHEADLARNVEVRTSADVEASLGHASSARAWQGVAIGSFVAGLALGGWAAYDVWRGTAPSEPRAAWGIAPSRDGAQVLWTQRF
jgi:hypothetical protein